jgi:hypothetical protein
MYSPKYEYVLFIKMRKINPWKQTWIAREDKEMVDRYPQDRPHISSLQKGQSDHLVAQWSHWSGTVVRTQWSDTKIKSH